MAITNPSGLTLTAYTVGVKYSKVTDSSLDWSGVSNSTYFFDKGDGLVHYKDSSGNTLEVFSSNFSTAKTGTTIHFSADTIFGTATTPETGNIINNLTNAQLGVVQKIYHNSGTAPSIPGGWILLGSTTYQVSSLNVIFAEWSEGNRVEYWIIR